MKNIMVIVMILFFCGTAKAAIIASIPAQSFLQSIAINTHLGLAGYTNLATIESQLSFVGITKVRDQADYAFFSNYLQLYNDTGTTLSEAIYTPSGEYATQQLPFIQTHAQMFWQVEGCNEPDGTFPCPWNGYTGNAAVAAFQYQLLKDITPLSVPLVTASVQGNTAIAAIGPVPAVRINIHQYLQFDFDGIVGTTFAPYFMFFNALSYFASESPGRPLVITESGIWTVPCSDGMTQNTQAKYIMDTPFDAFILGYFASTIYELNDQNVDSGCSTAENHFGLFNADGTQKVSATTFHNMTTLLSDTKSITPTSLAFTTTSLPANGHTLLLQKSDGTFWLAIWNDAQIWNFSTFQEITVNPISVTLNLTSITASTINVYDPYIGTSVQQTASGTSSIVLSVPDHVILVNIRP